MGSLAEQKGERLTNMVVIGDREEPRERKVIRDADGEVEVRSSFDTSPDWYEYSGHCRVNGDIFHVYNY